MGGRVEEEGKRGRERVGDWKRGRVGGSEKGMERMDGWKKSGCAREG